MINLTKKMLILGMVIAISLLVASCTNASTSDVGESSEIVEGGETEPIDQGQVSEENDIQPSESNETGTEEDNVPEDVPIMPGYRKLSLTSDASNISYEVDGTIDEVVTFYQEELANLGWEMSRSPDKTYSAFGTLSREKESGDRITISLQFNPIGEFVVVRLVILRP
jgi:hypothetical protein